MAWRAQIQTLPEQSRKFIACVLLAIAGAALFILFITRTRSSVGEISFAPGPRKEQSAPNPPEELKGQEIFLSPLEGLAESLKGFEETARHISETLRSHEKNAPDRVFQFAERLFAFAGRAAQKTAETLYGALGREVTPK